MNIVHITHECHIGDNDVPVLGEMLCGDKEPRQAFFYPPGARLDWKSSSEVSVSTTRNSPAVEAVMALLQAAPHGCLPITCLNKALFYLDLFALRDFGEPITGATYRAVEHGPILDGYKELISQLEAEGLAQQNEGWDSSKPVKVMKPLDSFPSIPSELLPAVEKLARSFSEMSATKASELSHSNPGWKSAWAEAKRNGSRAEDIDMLLAMQGIADNDPWLVAPMSEEELAASKSAIESAGEPW